MHPKPGKPLDQGPSYRPISLLCPEIKVLERLLLPDLKAALQPNDTQHGFTAQRSTATALFPLSTTISRGLNARKPASRTGMISVDISKAFDVVRRDLLLKKIETTDLHPNIKRWLLAYLADRRVRVIYQGKFSKWLKSKLGMPQGAVSSPPLWNFFCKDLVLVDSCELDESFADDFYGASSSSDIDAITVNLNKAADEMAEWADKNAMSLSAPKSSVTLFTSWTKQVNVTLDVKLRGEEIPTEKFPKILGVVFDPLHTFSHHAASISRRGAARLNMLRALADSVFGKDKECLLCTFKAFIRTLFDYCAAITYPIYAPSSIERLQKVQNKALRLAVGCHTAASVDHLHAEAEELPVEYHLRLLASQSLARYLQPGHVSYPYAQVGQGPRTLKHTLRSKCIGDVQPYLEADGSLGRGQFGYVKNRLHTDIVRKAIQESAPNRVLGAHPPPINKNENHLPRKSRVTLSQLRSGHCAKLKDYQRYKLGKVDNDTCTDCDLFPQTVSHLFDCPAHPTTLSTTDLWENPKEVVDHLRRFSAFDDLPRVSSPPRRQPRQRPPARPPDSPLFSPMSFPPSPPASPGPGRIPPLMDVSYSSISSASSFSSLGVGSPPSPPRRPPPEPPPS